MSNLGAYQALTTVAKKVGGPKNLILLTASAGAAIGITVYKGGEVLVKKGAKVIKARINNKKQAITVKQYVVKSFGISNEGVKFEVGEKFNVLATDGDAILIEKIGDENNEKIYYIINSYSDWRIYLL